MSESNSTVPKPPTEPAEASTPEDVATLYSWANLHGAKYRDFSAARAQAREEARLRAAEAAAAELRRQEEEAERIRQEEAQIAARKAAEEAEAARQAEADRLAEIARQAEVERQAVLAAQEAQRQALQQRGWQPPPAEVYQGGYVAPFVSGNSGPKSDYQTAVETVFQAGGFLAGRSDPASGMGIEAALETGARHEVEPGLRPFSSQAAYQSQNQSADSFGPGPFPEPFLDPFMQRTPEPARPASALEHYVPVQLKAPSYAPQSTPPAEFSATYQGGYQETGGGPVHGGPVYGAPARQYPGGFAAPQPGAGPAGIGRSSVASPAQGSPYAYPAPAASYAEYDAPLFSAPSSYVTLPQEPYMPSPWQPAESREEREARDQSFRPAWLAPELPAPSAPVHHPGTPAPLPSQPLPSAAQRYVPMYAQPVGQTPFAAQNSGQPPSSNPNQNPGQNPSPVEDTPGSSRDRIANRWYALKSVFDPQSAPVEQAPIPPLARVPVLAVFSLAGGVGKTSLVASLGRALSSRGERVLLVDTAAYGLLPFFFGARDQRPGQLRTFNPPGVGLEAPIQLVTLDPEGQLADPQNPEPGQVQTQAPNSPNSPSFTMGSDRGQDWLAQEVTRMSRGANRILIDLPTASGATTRRVLRLAPAVLVPVVPDMNSVVSVGAIEAFFRHSGNVGGKQILPYYVLNQFDYSLPLHLDVREILREQIGDRLLPFALRRSPAVSEALAEGMTVMDYAPSALVAEDYASLAAWVRSLSAPATQSYRGVRWSER